MKKSELKAHFAPERKGDMLNQQTQQMEKPGKVKFIVNESFSGTKSRTDLFSEMVLTRFTAATFTLGQSGDIIKSPTVKS